MALGDSPSSLVAALEALMKAQSSDSAMVNNLDDGFVVVAKESIWTKLFGQYFMGVGTGDDEDVKREHLEDDDMLFYVCNKPGEKEQNVAVFRRKAKTLPGLGDPHVNWEESVYLNLILHDLKYVLTCAVCCRLPTQDLKVLRRQAVSVHASPHMRRMDSKGESSDQSYPNIFFIVDSFDEVFQSLCVRQDEIVCVELAAKMKGTYVSIFLGSVKYESLVKVYDSKESIGSKMVNKMSMAWMAGASERIEFIRMRGPHGKGYAEMAVSLYRTENFHENSIPARSGIAVVGESDLPMKSYSCSCPIDHVSSNQIYSPTTAEHYPNCPARDPVDGVQSRLWSSSVKWFQEKKKSARVLNAHLTYITLPWSRIMKDVLQVHQKPIFARNLSRDSHDQR